MLGRYLSVIWVLIFVGCSSKPETCIRPTLVKNNPENMSFITGGKFLMGEAHSFFKDKPLNPIYVSSFYMDKSEVTNAMYKEYLGTKKCNKPPRYIEDPILGQDEYPIVDVSYQDAKGFCKLYGKRLPTEAEWEYAARGKLEMKKFPWGNDENPNYMNYRESGNGWAVSVKSYPPNKYGLYDMSGNVREWVTDTYSKSFYDCKKKVKKGFDMDSFFTAKKDCRQNPLNSVYGQYKVTRGGSWSYSNGYPATVSFRSFDLASYRGKDLGFRCASDIKLDDNIVTQKLKEFETTVMDGINEKVPEGVPTDISSQELGNTFNGKFDPSKLGNMEVNK